MPSIGRNGRRRELSPTHRQALRPLRPVVQAEAAPHNGAILLQAVRGFGKAESVTSRCRPQGWISEGEDAHGLHRHCPSQPRGGIQAGAVGAEGVAVEPRAAGATGGVCGRV